MPVSPLVLAVKPLGKVPRERKQQLIRLACVADGEPSLGPGGPHRRAREVFARELRSGPVLKKPEHVFEATEEHSPRLGAASVEKRSAKRGGWSPAGKPDGKREEGSTARNPVAVKPS